MMDHLSPEKKFDKSGNNSDSENDNSVLIISESHSRNNSQTSSNSDESDGFNTENLDQLLMKANLNINLNPSPLNRNKNRNTNTNTNTNTNENKNRNCNKNMNDESDIKENKENSNHLKIDSGSSIDSISAPNSTKANNSSQNMMDLLQRELYEKSQKLKVAYQASLELVEQNDSLHEQVESLEASIEMLQNSITDYELTIEQLKVEKEELSETVSAAQQGYEQIFGELTATQEKLYHAMDTIHDYERTIDQNSENAASMSVANDEYIKNVETNYKRELSMYKNKCEEISNEKSQLLKELEKYRYSDRKFNDLAEKYDDLKLERSQMNEKEKVLSDQLLELTYDKVALEKELQKMHKKMFEKENEVCELQNKTEELQHQLMSNNPQASNLMANSRFSRLYSYAAASGAKVGDNHTPPSDNGSFQFGVNDDSSALLARRLSKSLQSSRYYHNNSLLAELAGQIDPTSMYDDIRRSVSYEDGAKRRDSISRSHSPSNEREVSASPPAEESISDLSQLKDSGVREAIPPHDAQDDAEQKVAATELHESKSFSPARTDDRQNRKDDDEKEMESKNNTNEKNKNKNKTKISSENEEKKKENSRSKSSKGQKSVSPPLIRAKNTRKSDALEEYLHLTASAVKINYPSVDVSAAELIDRVRNLPFYQAHNALTRYMMERLQWEQIEQQRILQIKAAAIAAKEKESQLKRQNSGNFSKLFSRMFGGSSSTTSATNKSNHKNGNNDAGNNGNNIDHNRSQSTGALNGSNVTPMSGNNNNMHHSTMSTMSERERIQLNMINQVKPRATVTGGASLNLGSLEPPTHQVSSAKSRQYHSYRNDNLASNKSKASTMAGVSNIHTSGGGSGGNVGTKIIGASESPLTEHEQYLNNIKLNQGFPSPQIRNKNNKQVLSALDKHNKMVDLMITEPYSNPNKNRSNNKNRQIKRYTTEEIAKYLTKSGSGSSVISANKFPDKVSYLQAMRLRQQQYDRFRNELATANQRELDRNSNNNTNNNNNNNTNENSNINSSDNSDSNKRKTNNDNNEKIHRSMSNNSSSNNNNNKKKNKNKNSMNSMNNDNENNTILGLMSGKSNVLPLPLPSLQEHSEKGSIDTSPSKSQSKKSTLNTNNDAASPISNQNDNENENDNDNDTGTTMTTTTNSNQSKQ